MKRILRWLCPALFLLICAGMIWALHLFVVVNGHMEHTTWDSAVQILSDGTEVPFETDAYSNISDARGSYRFSGHLPEGLPAGSLIFETSGCSVTLSLNGTEIYRSSAATSQDVTMMSQATIPLPEGTTGASPWIIPFWTLTEPCSRLCCDSCLHFLQTCKQPLLPTGPRFPPGRRHWLSCL